MLQAKNHAEWELGSCFFEAGLSGFRVEDDSADRNMAIKVMQVLCKD